MSFDRENFNDKDEASEAARILMEIAGSPIQGKAKYVVLDVPMPSPMSNLNAAYDSRVPATLPLSQSKIHKLVKEAAQNGYHVQINYGVYGEDAGCLAKVNMELQKGVHVLGDDDHAFGDL